MGNTKFENMKILTPPTIPEYNDIIKRINKLQAEREAILEESVGILCWWKSHSAQYYNKLTDEQRKKVDEKHHELYELRDILKKEVITRK